MVGWSKLSSNVDSEQFENSKPMLEVNVLVMIYSGIDHGHVVQELFDSLCLTFCDSAPCSEATVLPSFEQSQVFLMIQNLEVSNTRLWVPDVLFGVCIALRKLSDDV